MAILAGRDVTLYLGGTPTTMTGQACSNVAGAVYRVTDAAKRIFDPATAITVYDGAGDESATATIDYAAGTITLAEAASGAVTVTAKYIPLHAWAECKSANITIPQDVMADVTRLGDASARSTAVLKKCELTVEHFTTPATDMDAGGGTLALSSLLDDDLIYVKAKISTVQEIVGWFEPTASYKHDLGSALTGTLTLVGKVQTCVGRPVTEQALFSLVTL